MNYLTNGKQGCNILSSGLSWLADSVIIKAVQAKQADRECIKQRVAQIKAEIESVERHRDLLNEIQAGHQKDFAAVETHMNLLMSIFDDRGVELCSALGWDLDLPRLSSHVSRTRPVTSGPYYWFPESREPGSHGRPAGLTVFRF